MFRPLLVGDLHLEGKVGFTARGIGEHRPKVRKRLAGFRNGRGHFGVVRVDVDDSILPRTAGHEGEHNAYERQVKERAAIHDFALSHERALRNGISLPQRDQVVQFVLWDKRLAQMKGLAQFGIAARSAEKKFAHYFNIALV